MEEMMNLIMSTSKGINGECYSNRDSYNECLNDRKTRVEVEVGA